MYRGVRHLMNNMRMRNKLLFSYVLIVMIPVLVVGGCVTFYLRQRGYTEHTRVEQRAVSFSHIKRICRLWLCPASHGLRGRWLFIEAC